MEYIIENKYLKATISSQGATLRSLIRKKDNLELIATLNDYSNNMEGHGAIIGPSSGRIFQKSFIMNEKKYTIPNFNKCLLHSGKERIANENFELKTKTEELVSFSFFYINKKYLFLSDQDIIVTYMLSKKQLSCKIESKSNEPKIMNYTNHTYFTLGSKDSRNLLIKGVVGPELELVNGVLTGKLKKYSAFNFTKYNSYQEIDTPFILKGPIYLKNPENNIILKVTSNQTAVVIYNDAFSAMEQKFKGIAIEMQGYPSAITFPHFPQNVHTKNTNTIKWTFNW